MTRTTNKGSRFHQPVSAAIILLLALLLLAGGIAGANQAGEQKPRLGTLAISHGLDEIEADLEHETTLVDKLDPYLERLTRHSAWLNNCIDEADRKQESADMQLAQLGGAVLEEAAEVRRLRETLLNNKSEARDIGSKCRALLVRNDNASRAISDFRKKNLEIRSFARGKNILAALGESVTESHQWIPQLIAITLSEQGIHALDNAEKLMLLSVALLVLVVGLMIRMRLKRWHETALQRWQKELVPDADTGLRALAALAMTMRRYIPVLLVSVAASIFIWIETRDIVPKPLLTIVMDGLPFLLSAYALTYFVYRGLLAVNLRQDLTAATANWFKQRLDLLATLWFLAYLLTQTILANSLSEAAFFIARAVVGTLLVINTILIIWHSRRSARPRFNKTIASVSSLVLIAALVAEYTGYRNLSNYLLAGVIGSLVALPLFQLLHHLLTQILDDLDAGKSSWQRRFRLSIGVKPDASFPGFVWLKLVSFIAVWGGFIALILWIWQVPTAEIHVLVAKITQGISIGSVELVPSKIFEAIIVLVLLLSANGWFQRNLQRSWLAATRIDRGAQESIATISNYVGVGLAIIIALAVAGLDFSNLALIAGALSVGIGFGLQNIVNNFVSGLILLFERPIKTGDWIVANGVEGMVKRISIRSTEIESFDRADIIVPNSLLISDNLTNWVHSNRYGRIVIPVGVAYGSDTELVRKLLIDIALQNKEVVRGHSQMHDPKVLFLAFGESSLDFELRFYVNNILHRLDITSATHFAIDKAFRENGVEIPFPQRDIHIRSQAADTGIPATPEPAENKSEEP